MRKVARLGVAIAVVAAVTGLGVAGLGPLPRASADVAGQWAVFARADAMAIEYLNTNAPIFAEEPVIYGTPATAASLVDSVGQSNAFAGAPYPGDIMVGMPENGNGAFTGAGGPGIFPSYPFYVGSEHPIAPDKVQDQSGNRVVAHSEQYMSYSDARSGLITGDMLAALQAQASSRSSVDNATGELTALADSRLDAFKLTNSLQIGRSVAHAKVTRAPGQDLVKESSFTIGSIIVNGVEMSYGDGGFKFGDQSPSSPGDPKPLFDALKSAGITVEILPATGTETSIDSAGMKITQVADYGAGKQRISFIIGRVSAAIQGEATVVSDPLLDTLPGTGTTGTDPVVTEPSTTEPTPIEEPTAPEPELNFAAGLDFPSVTLPDISIPPLTNGAATVPPIVAAVTPGPTQVAAPEVRLASPASVGRGLRDDDVSGFYLAVGGLAALMTVAAFLLAGGRRRAAAPAASVLRLPNP